MPLPAKDHISKAFFGQDEKKFEKSCQSRCYYLEVYELPNDFNRFLYCPNFKIFLSKAKVWYLGCLSSNFESHRELHSISFSRPTDLHNVKAYVAPILASKDPFWSIFQKSEPVSCFPTSQQIRRAQECENLSSRLDKKRARTHTHTDTQTELPHI